MTATYLWNFGDATESTLQSPSHTYLTAGQYPVELAISATCGTTTSVYTLTQSVDVIIATERPQLVIKSIADRCSNTFQFFTEELPDQGIRPESYRWDFGNGITATGAKVSHKYTTLSAFTVSLTVANCANEDFTYTKDVRSNLSTRRGRLYVDINASGEMDGSSWVDAYPHLQDALNDTRCIPETEIWVAKGTYVPNKPSFGSSASTNPADFSFSFYGDNQIYGGFAGGETTLAQRDYATNVTILSGDVDGDGTRTNNAKTVIESDQLSTNLILDGFTIRDGGPSTPGLTGGAWKDVGQYSVGSRWEPLIRNCKFLYNFARYGGAFYLLSTSSSRKSPIFVNCEFSRNYATDLAPAFLIENFTNSPTNPSFTNCTFADNGPAEPTNPCVCQQQRRDHQFAHHHQLHPMEWRH